MPVSGNSIQALLKNYYQQSSVDAMVLAAKAGRKNLLINPLKNINQRGTTGTAADIYYEDRWAGNGAGGQYQKVEALNVQKTGNYVLSWTGTATATVSISTDNVTYTVLAADITSGTVLNLNSQEYVKVDFSNLDFSEPQLEVGVKETQFDYRFYQDELILCQRYFEIIRQGGGDNYNPIGIGNSSGTGTYFMWSFKAEKRDVPVITLSGKLTASIDSVTKQSNLTVNEVYSPLKTIVRLKLNDTLAGGSAASIHFDAAQQLNGFLSADSEL